MSHPSPSSMPCTIMQGRIESGVLFWKSALRLMDIVCIRMQEITRHEKIGLT